MLRRRSKSKKVELFPHRVFEGTSFAAIQALEIHVTPEGIRVKYSEQCEEQSNYT